MDAYEVIVGLHIVGAVVLEIGAVGLLGCVVILANGNPVGPSSVAARSARLFDKAIPAGAALILLTGLYMGIDRWEMGEPWLVASLGALLVVAPLAPFFISPEVGKLRGRGRSAGDVAQSPRHTRLLIATAVLAAVSVAELFVMAIKPAGMAAATALLLAAFAGALLAVSYLTVGRLQ